MHWTRRATLSVGVLASDHASNVTIQFARRCQLAVLHSVLSDEARSERGAAADGFYSTSIVEVVGMEAHSLSSQYPLAVNDGCDSHVRKPSGWLHGDFAAGCRWSESESHASVRGDFATGMRSTPIPMTIGDFATGLRARPDAELVRGDFATGQRTVRPVTPSRDDQPEDPGFPRPRQQDTAKAA